jgi:hypothetical protein
MAVRMNPQVVCDYPGCERRVTELGGRMTLDSIAGPTLALGESTDRTLDLCREHRRSLESWWARGDKGESDHHDDAATDAMVAEGIT